MGIRLSLTPHQPRPQPVCDQDSPHPLARSTPRDRDDTAHAESKWADDSTLAENVWVTAMPDNPWIKILSYLDQTARVAVSLTCRRLHYLCLQEPCLWRSLAITLGADFNRKEKKKKRKRKVKLEGTEKAALRHCIASRGVQDIEIFLKDVGRLKFSSKSQQLLDVASKNLALRTVTISCDTSAGCGPAGRLLPRSIRQLLLNCLTSPQACRVETLVVRSWCWWDKGNKSAILDVLKDASFTDSLKELHFSWVSFCSPPRSQRVRDVSPEDVLAVTEVVEKFGNLQRLTVHALYVTDELLLVLAGAVSGIKHVSILGGYFRVELQESSWRGLVKGAKGVAVHMVGQYDLQCDSLRRALPACVPLTTFNLCLRRVGLSRRCQQTELLRLLPRYAAHLQRVHLDETNVEGGQELVEMVLRCPRLRSLLFGGRIKREVVLTVASMRRQSWWTLEFVDRNVLLPEGIRVSRRLELDRLCQQVSRLLGRRWTLLGEALSNSSPCLADRTTGNRTVGVNVRPLTVHV